MQAVVVVVLTHLRQAFSLRVVRAAMVAALTVQDALLLHPLEQLIWVVVLERPDFMMAVVLLLLQLVVQE